MPNDIVYEKMPIIAGDDYLASIERQYEWGEFCYLAVPHKPEILCGGIWRIGVITRGVKGYRPLMLEFWSGPDVSAFRMAFNLNKQRLHLGRRDVMFIIASALERLL